MQDKIDPPGEPGAEVALEIPPGSTTEDIGKLLSDNGVISSSSVWNYWTRLKDEGGFQAGFFVFRENSSFDEAVAVLDAICPRRHYLGGVGNGSRAKLAVNLILGLNRAALAEGLVFAERLGLDRSAFLEVARGSAAYSQVMDVKGALMARRDYAKPQSRVDQSLKDFRLMLAQAQTLGQELPFANLYARMLEDCVQHGEAEWDNAAIAEAIARRHA